MEPSGDLLLGIAEIIWINTVLSGDNAVVIALACRDLPPHLKRTGMIAGAGVAVVLRVVFTLLLSALLTTPFVKIVGGLLLLWIGAQLLVGADGGEGDVSGSDKLWGAIRTVAIADAVMSLDNVLAIAAVAHGSTFLLVLGLVISVPLVVAGAAIIMKVLERVPLLAWAGALLLGWVAGEMLISDPAFLWRWDAGTMARLEIPASVLGAALVLLAGLALRRLHARHAAPEPHH